MRSLKTAFSENLASFIVLFVPAIMATSSGNAQDAIVEENSDLLHVKYLEGNNDALHFTMRYNNTTGDDFKVMVVNETGEVLFQKNYSGKKFRKKIRLTRLTDSDGVTFLVRPSRENVQLTCKVRIPRKVIDRSTALN
jgi:hypothetical protein